MTLTKVEIYSDAGRELILPLGENPSGYILKDIEGLDPVKATMVSSQFAQLDGTQYQTSSRDNRNIVFKLGLDGIGSGQTVSALRQFLYARLMPKTSVMIRFFMDGSEDGFVQIEGRVETCQSPLFTQTPEMIISILCFDPDFLATGSTTTGAYSVDAFSDVTKVIPYPGSIETGIEFELLVDRPITEFSIYNFAANYQNYTMDFVGLLEAGDVVRIGMVSGAKYATLERENSETPIMYAISPASNWVNVFPGDNEFRVVVDGAPMYYNIIYRARYGGL